VVNGGGGGGGGSEVEHGEVVGGGGGGDDEEHGEVVRGGGSGFVDVEQGSEEGGASGTPQRRRSLPVVEFVETTYSATTLWLFGASLASPKLVWTDLSPISWALRFLDSGASARFSG
jgi:hypothetical protein